MTNYGPVKVAPEVTHKPVAKVGSIQLPHDCQGRLLEQELAKALEEFVHHMEAKGYTLYNMPGNPKWATYKGEALAVYAIDWEGTFKSTRDAEAARRAHEVDPQYANQIREAHKGALPNNREASLEDSDGLLEYRCVGVFWVPEAQVDIVVDSYLRKQQEAAARNPTVFGGPQANDQAKGALTNGKRETTERSAS